MVALRPGAPEFSVGDFIWQEIKHLSKDPKNICSYSPYIMYMIEKVAKTDFPKNVTHNPLKLNPSKNTQLPPPRVEQAPRHEAEITEKGAAQLDQPQAGAQAVTGLTGAKHRSDWWGGWEHGRPHRSTSPLRKFLNFIFGMCKSQHDIQVEQQRSRRANKQMRDTMKLMHNAQGFQPPRSPPSPESPQVEIPSFEDRMRGWANSNMLNQYGPMFFESEHGQGSSSSAPLPPPPPPPPFAPPSPPDVDGSSHYMEEEQAPPPPPPPEQGQDWGARFSAEIFGYNPYYYGKNGTPIAHPSQITISDSIYLNTPLHWIFDNSQIGESSHEGDRSQGQRSATASSPSPSWMLDDKGGEDSD
jgi:hypothetical protein